MSAEPMTVLSVILLSTMCPWTFSFSIWKTVSRKMGELYWSCQLADTIEQNNASQHKILQTTVGMTLCNMDMGNGVALLSREHYACNQLSFLFVVCFKVTKCTSWMRARPVHSRYKKLSWAMVCWLWRDDCLLCEIWKSVIVSAA